MSNPDVQKGRRQALSVVLSQVLVGALVAIVCHAIEGARAAGASEFIVADSHGNAQNLLLDQLPADVRVVRGFPRPLSMGLPSKSFRAVTSVDKSSAAMANVDHELGICDFERWGMIPIRTDKEKYPIA